MNAPCRPSDFVGELCIALAHRWEPERLFMFIYTGYLDESGTHGDSLVTVMGGALARANQWREFQTGFDAAKKRYGFRVLHTKKFKRRDGDFKGWNNEKCLALIGDLERLTSSTLTEGVAVSLHSDTYDRFYKGGGDIPAKARLDSKYGLCFRMCLYHLMTEVALRRYRKRYPPLHIVVEAGHKNYGDAERIFLEVKREFDAVGFNILRTLTKAKKDECDPLMIADFVAHTTFTMQSLAISAGRPLPPTQPVPRGTAGVTHFQSTPEGLADIRKHALAIAAGRSSKRTISSPSALGK